MRDSVTSISSTLSEQLSGLSVTALIVDDEKDICYLLTRILHLKNIKTLQANSLSEAEQIIERELPPVIFLDNYLPDGLGINTIKKIKIKAPKSKIVMISAHDNASERAKAQAEGADYFIEKPFTKDLIFSVLAKLCSFIS